MENGEWRKEKGEYLINHSAYFGTEFKFDLNINSNLFFFFDFEFILFL